MKSQCPCGKEEIIEQGDDAGSCTGKGCAVPPTPHDLVCTDCTNEVCMCRECRGLNKTLTCHPVHKGRNPNAGGCAYVSTNTSCGAKELGGNAND